MSRRIPSTSTTDMSTIISKDRDVRLIQAIRGYDVLYDPRCMGYKDPRIKESTWKLISSEVESTPEDCRNRWRSLRDRFVREKKAMLLGQAHGRNNVDEDGTPKSRKPWKLLEPMSFLWDFIMHRSRRGVQDGTWTTTLSDEQLIKLETGSDDGLVCEEDDETEGASYEWITMSDDDGAKPQVEQIQRKRQSEAHSPDLPVVTSASSLAVPHEITDAELHEEGPSVIKRSRLVQEEDEDTLFCKSVAHTLRRLAPRRKALAKLRVLQALYDAEFGTDVGPDVEVRLRAADI